MNTLTIEQQIKVNAALDVVNNSVLHGIYADIRFVKSILPDSYTVKESRTPGSIHCVSPVGIRKSPYLNKSTGTMVTDAEDDEHFEYIFKAIKQHFGNRFQEVFHNTCFCHVDFTIHLRARS